MKNIPSLSPEDLRLGILNLHDAYLNANMQRHFMEQQPVLPPAGFHVSDRGRFERAWVAFLYVLVECWNSKQMAPVVEYIRTITSIDRLVAMLRNGRKDGSLKRMEQVRHYMFHRDQKAYWDDGRHAVYGQAPFHKSLGLEFGRVLLAALDSLKKK